MSNRLQDTISTEPLVAEGPWLVGNEQHRPPDDVMDFVHSLDASLLECPQAEMELDHIFTPGIYVRQIFIRKGILVTSQIHVTEHPFMVMVGRIMVYYPKAATVIYDAPHVGITGPGTVRVLYSMEDTVWATIHANPDDERDIDKIIERITLPRIHHLKKNVPKLN